MAEIRREQHTVRSSFVFNTTNANPHKSFIHTAMAADGNGYDDLRGSRIMNLPNHRKLDLSTNLGFMVTFQTIEIERLSSEIEVLRVRLKEYEKQIFNAGNYEVQIRELHEKCFAQEREIAGYRDQQEKLNKICETLYHENEMMRNKLKDLDFTIKQKYQAQRSRSAQLQTEIDRLKNKLLASENSRMKELQDLRATFQAQRRSTVNREIREMTVRFESERSSWENDLRKAREMGENKNREINELKQRIQKLQITIVELKSNENIISDYEIRMGKMSQQLTRLNQILRDRDEDIHNQRQKEQKLSQQVKEQTQWEYSCRQLQGNLDAKCREVEDWKLRAIKLQEQVNRSKELTHYTDELEKKLNLAATELQRLNALLKVKLEEIDQWKKRLNDKDLEMSKYKHMENEMHNYQTKITNAKIENDKLNGILKARFAQIQDWKQKYTAIHNAMNNYANVDKDRKIAEEKYNSQIRITQEMRFTLQKMQADIMNYKKNELGLNELKLTNANLMKEIQRLNNTHKSKNSELNDLKTRHAKAEQKLDQYKNIEMKVSSYESKIHQLTIQLEKLNNLLKDRNDQITELDKEKIDMLSTINQFKNFQIKMSENEQLVKRIQDANNSLKRDVESLQKKVHQAEDHARDQENNHFRVSQEKEKLNNMMKMKNNETETLRTELQRYIQEFKIKKELESHIMEMQNIINSNQGDLQGYEARLSSMEKELQKEKNQSNEFAYKIIVLSCQIERLSQGGGSTTKAKQKEIVQLQDSYNKLQVKVTSKTQEIQRLTTRIVELQSKCEFFKKNYNILLLEAEKNLNETQNLLRKIEEYQNYAKKIAILGAEIDRLNELNKVLDKDNKDLRWKYADNIEEQKKRESASVNLFIMAVEIESLRKRLQDRQLSEDQLRRTILQPIRRT